MDTDRIEKQIELKAPPARVWRALTDYREFGTWFRVKLAEPFAAGATVRGQVTYPGYEHLVFEVLVKEMRPEQLFSFLWHPYAVDPAAVTLLPSEQRGQLRLGFGGKHQSPARLVAAGQPDRTRRRVPAAEVAGASVIAAAGGGARGRAGACRGRRRPSAAPRRGTARRQGAARPPA